MTDLEKEFIIERIGELRCHEKAPTVEQDERWDDLIAFVKSRQDDVFPFLQKDAIESREYNKRAQK